MQEFVESIVKRLVDNPDEVKVTKIESENNTIYELTVAPEDLGKVIGKHGRLRVLKEHVDIITIGEIIGANGGIMSFREWRATVQKCWPIKRITSI